MGRVLNILQVSMFDMFGGAERIASTLHEAYRARGHRSWIAVGRKRTCDPDVLPIPNHRATSAWPRFWWRVHHSLQPVYDRSRAARMLCRAAHRLAEPEGVLDRWRGIEDFNYPGTWRLLDMTPQRPDIVHAHNLHRKYFDLRALPWLCRQVPVVLTLHDAWLLTGHCAHPFDCARWESGCGRCPDLTIHPPVRRDATAYNWRRKQRIFADSRLCVATPSRWLMQQVERSMLAPAVVEARVIPHGVDLAVFRPADRQAARAALGLPADARILLCVAVGMRTSAFKDYGMLRDAFGLLAARWQGSPLLLVSLGEDAPRERIGRGEVVFVPFQRGRETVARYYQAADVYLHAARADTFPTTVLEAVACGTPVVATAVGGIPEQIRSLEALSCATTASVEPGGEATGVLVRPGDAAAMADAAEHLLNDESLRRRLAGNAAADARRRLDIRRAVDAYLAWYEELIGRTGCRPGRHFV